MVAVTGAASTSPANSSGSKVSELSGDTFLKLMLAQLKNQDPLHAQDASQYLTQLAQLTQTTSTQRMQESIAELSTSMRSSQALQGTSLVGRNVLANGSYGDLAADGSLRGAVEVPTGTTSIDVVVRDSAGGLVTSFSVPASGALTDFSWDGSLGDGSSAPPGRYQIKATGHIGSGSQALTPMIERPVTSVTVSSADGSLTLNTPTGTLTLADVRRVM